MSLIGNLLWLVLGGGVIALILWVSSGVIFCISIIGIPAGKASFHLCQFIAQPTGKMLIDARLTGVENKAGTGIFNFLWFLFAGWWLAVIHTIAGVLYSFTIIGISCGRIHFQIASFASKPIGIAIVKSSAYVDINKVPDQCRGSVAQTRSWLEKNNYYDKCVIIDAFVTGVGEEYLDLSLVNNKNMRNINDYLNKNIHFRVKPKNYSPLEFSISEKYSIAGNLSKHEQHKTLYPFSVTDAFIIKAK